MNKRVLYRNILIIDQIEKLVHMCALRNLEVCILKGGALISSGIFGMHERDMEDIDILIKDEDYSRLRDLLISEGYRQVCSGEHGFYREGENALLDIHTGIPYMKDDSDFWVGAVRYGSLKIPSPEDNFIYVLYHGLVHHGSLSGQWKEDLLRIIDHGADMAVVREKAVRWGLAAAFSIAMEELGMDNPAMKKNTLKERSMKFLIQNCGYVERGHYLRLINAGGWKDTLLFIVKSIFPGMEFLKRRYRVRPAEIMYYVRPVLLFLKMVQGAFLFDFGQHPPE